jgi:DNA mismatch repair protein MutS2
MHKIYSKTLQDLEFSSVLEQVSSLCITVLGKEAALEISPLTDREVLESALNQTNEYLASFENDNTIPNHYFDAITPEIKLLKVENSLIEVEGFRRIALVSETVNNHIQCYKKFAVYYPNLYASISHIEYTKVLQNEIHQVIDRFGEIKDTASSNLQKIRRDIAQVRTKINQSFGGALSTYTSAGYLDDIRETVIDNRRVLAVTAMYRKRVKGAILGNSKTGSIVYIEPEATRQYSHTLTNLEYDEQEEIQKILRELTNFLRPFRSLLIDYEEFLIRIDTVAAKAKYARQLNAVLPQITTERRFELIDAYHPLLYHSNKASLKKTYPQTIELHQENRIIVISGPNAGGKSITLKTVGLLQLMLQSGLLVPVHQRSTMCLFDRILTDIGDNQSIENHLSTYSYRLKNMNFFLRKCNDKTLFLIDEFGTGSDPELGGALAETFLEVFYEKEAFGIITTHYSNLKILANELPFATNANMRFDNKTLEPVFKLVLGEAGSSFTFEVAQKNGIPYSLINRAKKKIERGKVRFDATIAKLQKQRSKMEKTSTDLIDQQSKAREEAKRLEELNVRIKDKLEKYQQLYDHNQRMISLGNKVNTLAEDYFMSKKKRPLISEFLRIVETENSKRKQESAAVKKKERAKKKVVETEVQKQVQKIRERKQKEKAEKIEQAKIAPKPRPTLKVGDRVRLLESKSVGTIDIIEKNKATVNYGIFTTKVSLDQLELVEAKKKK